MTFDMNNLLQDCLRDLKMGYFVMGLLQLLI